MEFWVEFSFVGDDNFAAAVTGDHACVTPGEIIHVPEGIQRESEGEDRDRNQVDDHPSEHFPLSAHDENEGLKTVDGTQEDERSIWEHRGVLDYPHDEINDVGYGHGLDDSTEQIDKDDEAHTEAAKPAELLERDQFNQVMHRRVDPSTTLGQEYREVLRSDGPGPGTEEELCFVIGVVLQ